MHFVFCHLSKCPKLISVFKEVGVLLKEKQLFFNPFRLISPKLNAEASRLDEIYESRPQEMTCLEEGLLVMLKKLHAMADLL